MTAALFLASTPLALRACYGRIPRAVCGSRAFCGSSRCRACLHGWVNFGDVRHYALVLVEALLVCWASSHLFSRVAVGVTALWCYVNLGAGTIGVAHDRRWAHLLRRVDRRGARHRLRQNAKLQRDPAGGGPRDPCRPHVRPARHVARAATGGVADRCLYRCRDHRDGVPAAACSHSAGARGVGLTAGGNLKARLRNGVVTLLAIGALTYSAFTATVMKNRLERRRETGTLAGREQLWPSLADMALEKPWAGWGRSITNTRSPLAPPTWRESNRDAHNLLLELLTHWGWWHGPVPHRPSGSASSERGGAAPAPRHCALRADRAVSRRERQHHLGRLTSPSGGSWPSL